MCACVQVPVRVLVGVHVWLSTYMSSSVGVSQHTCMFSCYLGWNDILLETFVLSHSMAVRHDYHGNHDESTYSINSRCVPMGRYGWDQRQVK